MKTIKNNYHILKYVLRFCPPLVIFSFFYMVASVVLSIIKIRLIKDAINLVSEGSDIKLIYKAIIVFIIIVIVTSFFRIFYTYYINPRYRVIYIKKMQNFMFSKVKNIDMESFDNPEFYNNYSRALRDGIWRGIRVFEDFVRFVTAVAITIALGIIIIASDVVLILIILVTSIINIFVVNAINKRWYKWSKDTESERRMYNYVNRTFYRQRFAGEIKTTKVSELLIGKYRKSAKTINEKYAKTHKTINVFHIIHNFSKGLLEQGATYLYLGYQLFEKGLKLADFTANLNATFQFSSNFIDAIRFLTSLRENSFYIDDFLWLVNYKPKLEEQAGIKIGEVETLELKNVSFTYPDTAFSTLKDINLSLKKGEKIAIVGPNGGGKTTLTKLLLHFYLPTAGFIFANGKLYDEIDGKCIRSKYAIIFQDFQIYALTIGENVLMRKVLTKADEANVWASLEKVGMKEKIEQLPEGIFTQVTREFNRNGAVFSGGEVQRLAIARVFASEADIYILDEPTSSLDPLSEERINKLIIRNTEKAMIIIAHRLSTVVDADKIYLINNGQIEESGTHNEMMRLNGLYAKMFNTQKSLYEKS